MDDVVEILVKEGMPLVKAVKKVGEVMVFCQAPWQEHDDCGIKGCYCPCHKETA